MPAANATDNGEVLFYDPSSLAFLGSVEVGALPDMVTFDATGAYLLVANEGQSADGDNAPTGDPNPEGSVSIIEVNRDDPGSSVVTSVVFSDPSITFASLAAKGVRVNRDAPSAAADLEPEYITIEGTTAFITLQENNAVAVIEDITNPTPFTIDSIQPLGVQNHGRGLPSLETFTPAPLDPSNRDGGINIASYNTLGLRQPDAIASYAVDGVSYYVVANEGDGRDVDESRGADLVDGDLSNGEVDAGIGAELIAQLGDDTRLGRLKFSNVDGDIDGDGDIDQLYNFGARSFSIFDEFGNLVYDSGADFELITERDVPELPSTPRGMPAVSTAAPTTRALNRKE